ncbi:MAG: bacterial transcriptional activator domain-containing protein [Eggerthellaceae bacterium]|nr:bacterial transcriptional activator domain-containing protein [Eggerthellaceae bacterium]
MTSYLKDRLCQGFPPQRVNVAGSFNRDALVSRLMMDRQRTRLICAPSCMGKTTLAYAYAQLVFSFDNVLWLDAAHPCILRDLDDGSLAQKLSQVLRPGGLVVFEDVPWFGSVRKQRFSTVCEDLLLHKYEVIVTAIPECDPFGGNWSDCIVLSSLDLLFSDAEIEEMRMRGILPPYLRVSRIRANRIPGMRDRTTGTVERFLAAQLAEARSALESALTMALVLLGSGRVEDLSEAVGVTVSPEDLRVADLRPYVELHEFRNRFSADGFPVSESLRALQPYAKSVCRELPGSDSEAFLCRIADILLRQGKTDRAANVIIGGCSPASRAVWLMRNFESMLEDGNPLSVVLVYRSLGSGNSMRHVRMVYANGLALCLLGSRQAGVEKLLSVARRRDASEHDRMRAATIAALYSDRSPTQLSLGESFGTCCLHALAATDSAGPLELVWNALLEGDSGLEQLCALPSNRAVGRDWLLAASCCLRTVKSEYSVAEMGATEQRLLRTLVSRMVEGIQSCIGKGSLGTTLALAADELDSFGAGKLGWSHSGSMLLAHLESRLRSQRSAYEKLCETGMKPGGKDRMGSSTLENVGTDGRGVLGSVPLLDVRVFGGFEVSIGDHPADMEKLSRLKVRALLALLVLDAGKDISCEHLGLLLWPDSVPEKARRNFYSIYSMLNRALATPEGDSPYLMRSQGVCRLNVSHLRSDASELLEVCNQMRFGRATAEESYLLLEQLCTLYRGELLPGEATVPAIAAARSRWRNRVVDCVLHGARELQSGADIPAALEYAKTAVSFDPYREDCYELLMVLQMTSGQRTAAIETFFAYNRMNRELGLGTSARMVDLYNCIINDEKLADDVAVREPMYA